MPGQANKLALEMSWLQKSKLKGIYLSRSPDESRYWLHRGKIVALEFDPKTSLINDSDSEGSKETYRKRPINSYYIRLFTLGIEGR